MTNLNEEQRAHVTRVIAECERRYPGLLQPQNCRQNAQALAVCDDAHRITYIEGSIKFREDGMGHRLAIPQKLDHAWNTCDDIRFDLTFILNKQAFFAGRTDFGHLTREEAIRTYDSMLATAIYEGSVVPVEFARGQVEAFKHFRGMFDAAFSRAS